MEKYVPDIYQKSIYTINYQNLKDSDIKCLLFDLNNTLVPYKCKNPSDKLKKLIRELKSMDFEIIICSNYSNRRLKPFINELGVDAIRFAFNPSHNKILNLINNKKLDISEVALVGNQVLTDIVVGNSIGITTILVNSISTKDSFITKLNRSKEIEILKKLSRNNLLKKGKYYD